MHDIIQLRGSIGNKKGKQERIDQGYGYEIFWPFT